MPCDRVRQLCAFKSREHRQREFAADALHAQQEQEGVAFGSVEKAVEPDVAFACL